LKLFIRTPKFSTRKTIKICDELAPIVGYNLSRFPIVQLISKRRNFALTDFKIGANRKISMPELYLNLLKRKFKKIPVK